MSCVSPLAPSMHVNTKNGPNLEMGPWDDHRNMADGERIDKQRQRKQKDEEIA